RTDTYDYISPGVGKVLGYEPEEFMTMSMEHVLERFHPDDIKAIEGVLAESLSGDQASYQVEYRFRHKDGRYHWFSDLFTVVKDAQGHPLYRVGSVRNITERKRSEEELRESEAKLRALFEILPVGVTILDKQLQIVDLNPTLERILHI